MPTARFALAFLPLLPACGADPTDSADDTTGPATTGDASAPTAGDASAPTADDTTDDVVIECPSLNLYYVSDDRVTGLYSQSDVDMLAGCTDVDGSLNISGGDIIDLTPLSSLRRVAGTLTIDGNSRYAGQPNGPAALAGLESLASVRDLDLRDLGVPDLTPFAGLTDVPGDLSLSHLWQLGSLEGLHNITGVGGTLKIEHCDKIADVEGLRGLQSVGDLLSLSDLPITSLHGLESLTQVGAPGVESRVYLSSMPGLASLDDLAVDWRAEHTVQIYSTGILDLQVLAGVDELTGLHLSENDALTSLAGLEDLTTVREILYLGNNALTDLSDLTRLETLGALSLVATAVSDLGPLPALAQPGDLRLADNEQLASLSALSGRTALRSLVVERNPALAAMSELVDLEQVDGDLELRDNASLTNLDDLAAVTAVAGRLAVVYHAELLQTDAEAWAAPIAVVGLRKVVGNKGYDVPPLDPCPWMDDGECDEGVCIFDADGFDCLSD